MRQFAIAFFAGVLCLPLATAAWAQTQAASVHGRVTDSSGALVPGAQVTLTNVNQGRSWNFQTNEAGEYVFVQIPPGDYALSVEIPGFKKYLREGLMLEVAQIAELDVSLEMGAVTETIEAVAAAPMLETACSTLGS